jgi:hypothetical protein
LHDFCSNLDNRIDYPGEIEEVKQKILQLGVKYKENGFNPIAILMGDVNNRSYRDVNKAVLNNNYWIAAKEIFSTIYSVLGNHETSYYSSNPFFTLVNSIDSVKLQNLQSKVWQPVGIFNVFNVVDYVEDGDVEFHFNHYGCPVTLPSSDKFNIGLFHTDFVFQEILKASEDRFHNGVFATNIIKAEHNEFLELYDLCFFAHHHKIYGCWKIETENGHKCVIYHLASLGRPNVTEVNNNFLERNIPVVITENGKFINVEDNKFNLRSREASVREDVVEINKESYARVKALRNTNNYVPIKDDPIENVKLYCASDNYLTRIVEDLLLFDKDSLTTEIEKEVNLEGVTI